MLIKILLIFCLIELVEVQVISTIYDLIAFYLNTQLAFFFTWGEIICTFLFALKLMKTIGPKALQSMVFHTNQSQTIQKTLQQSFALIVSAFCLLVPGYLSDLLGLLILAQVYNKHLNTSSFNIASFLQKMILGGNTTQKKQRPHYQFYSQYTHEHRQQHKRDPSENSSDHHEVIDVEPINETQKVTQTTHPKKRPPTND